MNYHYLKARDSLWADNAWDGIGSKSAEITFSSCVCLHVFMCSCVVKSNWSVLLLNIMCCRMSLLFPSEIYHIPQIQTHNEIKKKKTSKEEISWRSERRGLKMWSSQGGVLYLKRWQHSVQIFTCRLGCTWRLWAELINMIKQNPPAWLKAQLVKVPMQAWGVKTSMGEGGVTMLFIKIYNVDWRSLRLVEESM